MKKKVLIIANFMRLPWEKGNNRFPYIANLLDKQKCDVEVITSDFYHGLKSHRDFNQEQADQLSYKIKLIHELGYKKNISIKRFFSHYIFGKNVEKYLKKIEKPDIIYCAIPSLDVARVAAKFAKKHNIKFIIDIQDLWPEAFKMVFNIPVISNIVFYPLNKKANYIYKNADDIIAVSDTYLDRAIKVNKKQGDKFSVFLGTDLEDFDKYKKENKVEFSDDCFRIAYIGTLGHSYDIKCVIDALEILKNKKIDNIIFEVMGDGPLKNEFEKYAKQKNISCNFTGRLDYNEMVGRLCSCDIAINPIKKGSAGSIINKVGDYAASGLPIINTQDSKEYCNIVNKYEIGFNCQSGNSIQVAEKIELLYKNEQLRKNMGGNNRKLAEEKFDRKQIYKQITNLIENN